MRNFLIKIIDMNTQNYFQLKLITIMEFSKKKTIKVAKRLSIGRFRMTRIPIKKPSHHR